MASTQENRSVMQWVALKERSHQTHAHLFKDTEKGFPLYLQVPEVETSFYLYETSASGDCATYYGVEEEVIALLLTPYDFGDEKRIFEQILAKRAEQNKKNTPSF